MDYGRPELANRLAAEYALGTMRGGARRRMETLMSAHPTLRRAVAYWEDELLQLGPTAQPQTPSDEVWRRIEARLFQDSRAHVAEAPVESGSWWRSLSLWRGWSAMATVAALAMFMVLRQEAPPAAPMVIVLQANPQASGQPFAVQASFVASLSADGKALVLKPIDNVAVSAGRALELWSLPAAGAPRSLGLVQADRTTTLLKTSLPAGTTALAVSVEPEGGSPTGTPTGPVVSVGKLDV